MPGPRLAVVLLACGTAAHGFFAVPAIRHAAPVQLSVAARRPLRSAPVRAAEALRKVVVTDMDETLIASKSTGYVITFLVQYRAFVRLLLLPLLAPILIPLSKVARTLAVRLMYWFAFRGINTERARRVAADQLGERYANDLQDPATSAVLQADEAVVITASPDFMARPWLERFLRVPAANVYGAVLEEKNGRFTGRTFDIPIGEKKVELLQASGKGEGASTTGYGDHPTDVPFLQACDHGVLVQAEGHELSEMPAGIELQRPSPFPLSRLPAERQTAA